MAGERRTMRDIFKDRIFFAHVAGWFAGVIAGTVYAGFYWRNLQHEFGRSMLLGVTVALVLSCWLSFLLIDRVQVRKP